MSADRFPRCSDNPLWKHLIGLPFTKDQRVSLIEDLLSDRSEMEALMDLGGADAQSFIDVVDEVSIHAFIGINRPADLNPNPPITLSRYWMTWRRCPGGGA